MISHLNMSLGWQFHSNTTDLRHFWNLLKNDLLSKSSSRVDARDVLKPLRSQTDNRNNCQFLIYFVWSTLPLFGGSSYITTVGSSCPLFVPTFSDEDP